MTTHSHYWEDSPIRLFVHTHKSGDKPHGHHGAKYYKVEAHKSMDKSEAISIIENTFPIDSQYPESREIGKRLLEQAETEVNNWRNKPLEVLVRYAELCQQEDDRQTRNMLRKQKEGYGGK
jgi:capsule polysaccharide export protein KpsE/RkpR